MYPFLYPSSTSSGFWWWGSSVLLVKDLGRRLEAKVLGVNRACSLFYLGRVFREGVTICKVGQESLRVKINITRPRIRIPCERYFARN